MAIAAAPGSVELFVNLANASLTTASPGFVAAASAAPGWCGERWPGRFVALAITFDQLIERYGEPIFAKVDVEGFEAEALAGLSRPIEAFSFEFTTILRRVAIDCVTRCRALGAYRYNAALGETQRLAFTQWVDADAIERWLRGAAGQCEFRRHLCSPAGPGNPRRNLAHGQPNWSLFCRAACWSRSKLGAGKGSISSPHPYLGSHPDPSVWNLLQKRRHSSAAKPRRSIRYGPWQYSELTGLRNGNSVN